MDELKTERSFYSQATWIIDVLSFIILMFSMGVCITRHLLTSGRLVQELDVCTVPYCEYPTVCGKGNWSVQGKPPSMNRPNILTTFSLASNRI